MKEIQKDEKALKKASKKSLKTMRKTRSRHIVREKARIVKYGTKGFGRNIWLSTAATAVMCFTLVILFVTIVASVVLNNTAQMMKDKIDITIYFKPSTSATELQKLADAMKADSNVKSVDTSTSEEEYAKFLVDYADQTEIINILDEDMKKIMIDQKMQSTMRIKVYDVENLDSIKDLVENSELFRTYTDKERLPTYDLNRLEIATITSWARIVRTAGIILAVVFLVISILIIFSTIRMAIFSRREEIYMMKLVGADKAFIRGPFLIEAEICGVIAGVLAGVISYFSFQWLAPRLADYGISVATISDVLESNQLIFVFLAFIGVGILIGRISARLAVSKYLHQS